MRLCRSSYLVSVIYLAIALLALDSRTPVFGARDVFDVLGVERLPKADLAPDLKLPSLGGGEVHIKSLRGKVVLFGFFTTT